MTGSRQTFMCQCLTRPSALPHFSKLIIHNHSIIWHYITLLLMLRKKSFGTPRNRTNSKMESHSLFTFWSSVFWPYILLGCSSMSTTSVTEINPNNMNKKDNSSISKSWETSNVHYDWKQEISFLWPYNFFPWYKIGSQF